MSLYSEEIDQHYILDDFPNKLKRKSNCWTFKSVKSEEDKKARREVANNNERRRMQSINTGFENLRKLLPHCVENDKISKAAILQTTAKYILELKTKINSLENDLLRTNSESVKIFNTEDSGEDFLKNVGNSTMQTDASPSFTDFGSSTSLLNADNLSTSTISLKSCDVDQMTSSSEFCSTDGSCQPQSTLEHLLAAVAQVERQEALQTGEISEAERAQQNPDVMKPMISPYAEQIMQEVANNGRTYFNPSAEDRYGSLNRSLKIAIPHKYLHRPDVVLSRGSHS